ncbi:MAG: glycosyltransferase family 4 protein [Actinobacteria bacterium]|nr:MAG: glycosyltransferase family 4 protein [Actinomycetota bacterium]
MTGRRPSVPRTLVVTNDFPPRVGGVQQYVWNLVANLPSRKVAVLAPNWPGWREHDERMPVPVHRWPTPFMWPTDALFRRVLALIEEHRAQVVLFGHGFPLPVMGPRLAAAGVPYVVLTHGAEVWLARTPAFGAAMRRAFAHARAVTAVSHYTARALRPLVPSNADFTVLHPAVDVDRFSSRADGAAVRAQHGLEDRRVVLCVSRLVPRKGQDVLIAGLPTLERLIPGVVLLIVGDGPYRGALERQAAPADGGVVFAGEVPDAELPAYYAAGDVFAMPCRSRWGGLEVEGFGIVYLEAGAAGRAAVAGRSGGSEEAVADEVTGLLVEGGEPKAVALALARLLRDGAELERMGASARARVEQDFTWTGRAQTLAAILRAAVA